MACLPPLSEIIVMIIHHLINIEDNSCGQTVNNLKLDEQIFTLSEISEAWLSNGPGT